METVRIIIADDHQLFIAGLKTILREVPNQSFEIVGVAHNGQNLLDLLKEVTADLIILDLNMPERDGLDVIGVLRELYPDLRILALTMYDESKIVKSAFKSGVDGYILKNVGMDELLEGIEVVMEGKRFFGRGVRLNVSIEEMKMKEVDKSRFPYEDRFTKKYNLTKRELEILKLITLALSNKEIAKELFISDQTVSVHRKNIMRKLGVSNTAGLLKIAYDNSLI
ncbi:MAG: response regulator transcription factor [Bacteroidota bacterium]